MTHKLIYFLSQSRSRSMIAEAWAKKLSLGDVTFISGSWLNAKKTPFADDALQEFSIDPPASLSFPPSNELLRDVDLIITIYDSTHELAPGFPDAMMEKVSYWDIEDPEQEKEPSSRWASYQKVCDHIALSVKNLEQHLIEA
ncbi:low molecular weight phosphatase family protein [Listeria sp. PSOL-1]|uniref:low molecular weight phosphatase family protein n=1 Tax=Listeria sp. PSOL-1 TaxID=1844999 RepID=UPI0013D81E86|nr:low molecular weight phosphatase family protein [Listeria sp. PSOL-1]